MRIDAMDTINPGQIERGFRSISVGEWDSISPWEEFLDGTNVHLGKRSSGWKFLWNWNDSKYYKTKEELFEFIRSGRVVDVKDPNTVHNDRYRSYTQQTFV